MGEGGGKIGSRSRALATTIAALTALCAGLPAAKAANTVLFWDADGAGAATGGTGPWDTTSSFWRLTNGSGALQTYTNTSPSTITANFVGSAGTVTLADGTNLNVNTILFGANGYVINPGSSSTIVLSADAGATNATPTITTGTGNTATINAILDGTAGLVKSNDTGTLVLGGANIYSGGTTLSGGTLSVTNATGSATGTGTVTLNGGTLIGGAGGSTFAGAATSGFISGDVTAGSGAHTIAPGGVGTFGHFAINNLTTNSNTTLSFDLTAPETATDDELLLTGTSTIGAGTQIAIGGAPSTNGYYRLINTASLGLSNFTIATAAPVNHAFVLASGSNGALGDSGWTDLAVVTSQTWKASTNGNWSAAGSWANGVVPNGVGDIATGAAGTNTSILDTNVTLGALNSAVANVVWNITASGGNSLTMQNVPGQEALIKEIARATLTITSDLVIGSTDGLHIVAAGDTNASGVSITGNITGTGPLTLDTGSVGGMASTSVTINGSLNFTGALTVTGVATTVNGSIINAANLATVTIGAIAPSVTSITKNGATVLKLTDTAGTYTHGITINTGLVQLTNTGSVKLGAGNAAFVVNAGAVLAVNAGGAAPEFTAANIDTLLANNATFNVGSFLGIDTSNAASGFTFASVLTGALGLEKLGLNTLTLSANNTYTGKTVIQNGTVNIATFNSVNGGTPLLASSTLGAPTTVANGTIDLGAYSASSSGNNNIGGTATLVYTGSGETTDRVLNLVGPAVITQSGTGLLRFTSNLTSLSIGTAGKTLTLQGSTTGNGEIDGNIVDSTSGNKTGIIKTGTNTWTLAGANSYTGVTTVSGGTLQISKEVSLYNNNATGGWIGTNIIVNSGTTLTLNVGGSGEFTSADVATLAGLSTSANNGFRSGSILGLDTSNAGGSFTLNNSIANPFGGANVLTVTKFGNGTLTLNAANTFTGGLVINAGIVRVGNTGAFNAAAPNAVTFGAGVAAGTKLQLNGTNVAIGALSSNATPGSPVVENGSATTAATLLETTSTSSTFAGVIQDGGAAALNFSKAGTSALTLTGVNTYTGATNIAGAGIILNGTGTDASTSGYTLTSGTLVVDNSGTVTAKRLGAVGMTLQNGTYSQTGQSATATSTSETVGTLTLDSGGNTITLTQGVKAGTSTLLTASNLARNNHSTAFVRGTSLGQGSTSTNTALLRLTTNPSGAAGNLIGGNGTIGGTAKNVAIIPFLVGDSSATGTGTSFVGYDATNNTMRVLSLTNEFLAFGTATANLSTAGSSDNVRMSSNNATVAVTGSTVNSAIFDEANAGGAVTYTLTGTLTANSGALLFSKSAGTARAVTLTGGLLQFSSSDGTTSRMEGIITNTTGAALTINSQISGSGGLTLNTYNAGSTIRLGSTSNNYSGITTVNGSVSLGAAEVIPDASEVYVGQGGTLDLNGNSETIDALSGSGTVDTTLATNTPTLTIGSDNGSGNFSGVIKNSGATGAALTLTKTGTGTQTLAGANTYTGATNVNAGTLLVTGSISGSVKVAAGATLGGSGTVGAITAGATNAGHVSTGGGHILTSGSTEGGTGLFLYDFQFNQTGSPTYSSSTASGNDLLRLTSSTPFTFGSLDSSNPVNIYLTTANNGDVFRGGFFTDQLTASALLTAVQAAQFHYFVQSASGSFTFDGVSYAALDPSQIALTIFSEGSGNFASGTVSGTELQLSVIPEPATGGILLSGFGMLVGLQRIRRRTRGTSVSELKARR